MSEFTIDQTSSHVRTVTSAQQPSPTKDTAEGSTGTEAFNTVQTCTDTESKTVTVCPPSTDYDDARQCECPSSVVEVPVEVLPSPPVEEIVVPIEVSPPPSFAQSSPSSRTMNSWYPEITEITPPPSQRISIASSPSREVTLMSSPSVTSAGPRIQELSPPPRKGRLLCTPRQ